MLIVLASCNTNTKQASAEQAQGVVTADNIYNIETAQSQITWTGREVSTSSHYGTLAFVSGNFEISNGEIVNGVGSDTDIVIASAKSYLDAINKLNKKSDMIHPHDRD